jgi:hypothetical protein
MNNPTEITVPQTAGEYTELFGRDAVYTGEPKVRGRVLNEEDEQAVIGGIFCAKCTGEGSYNKNGLTVCDSPGYDNKFPEFCPCPGASLYRAPSGNCEECPKGFICSNNKVLSICPKGRYCEEGTTTPTGNQLGGKKCSVKTVKARLQCQSPGSYNKKGNSVCDKDEPGDKPELCKGNWERGWGFGVTVFMPGKSGDMDGSGSWDVTVSIGGIKFFKGKSGFNDIYFLNPDMKLTCHSTSPI